jgi:hAT family C-terminal dimerisation region
MGDRVQKSLVESLISKKSERVALDVHEKGKSEVWANFFVVSVDNNRVPFACCVSCKGVVAYSSKTGTGSLQRHKCLVSSTPTPRQPSARDFMRKTIPDAAKEAVAMVTVKFVTKDLRPFKCIEDEGFRALGQELIDVGAKFGKVKIGDVLCGRAALSRNYLNKTYDKVKQDVVKLVGVCGPGAFTTDLWTDGYRQRSFISLTCHLIDEDYELKSLVLGTREFHGKHTALNIRKTIVNIISEFTGSEESAEKTIKSGVFVTDNGANVVAAFKNPCAALECEDDDGFSDVAYRRLSCACHSLNLALNLVLEKRVDEVPGLRQFLEKCKKIVKYFKKSGLNSRLNKTLKQEVVTRWNSLYTMLESIYSAYDQVKELLYQSEKMEKLAGVRKQSLKELTEFLNIFKCCSERLSAEKTPTLHEYCLWKLKLTSHCDASANDSEMMTKIKVVMRSSLNEKFKPDKMHYAALFLHPNFKSLRMLTILQRVQATTLIDTLFREEERRQAAVDASVVNARAGTPEVDDPPIVQQNGLGQFAEFMDVVNATDEVQPDELVRYTEMKAPSVDADQGIDILLFWKEHQNEFPLLAKVARRILAIPASSAASERLFSRAGRVLEERRAKLSSANADKILFLHHNL